MKPILQGQGEERDGQYSWGLAPDFSCPRAIPENMKSGFVGLASGAKRVHMLAPMGKEGFSGQAVSEGLPKEDLDFFGAR